MILWVIILVTSFCKKVSERIKNLVRKSDTISRLGGDEFVILLENIDKIEFCSLFSQKIVETLKPCFTIEHHKLHIACSIGISIYPDDGNNAIDLLKNADTAMYRAKEVGRDGFIQYSKELSDLVAEKNALECALRYAVDKNELYLQFQPIVDITRNRIIGSESLLRWNSTELGFISPEKFIPTAESSKLIIHIGYWIFEQSVKQLKSWQKKGIKIEYISINVSIIQLYHEGFVENLFEIINKLKVAPSSIQLEITENVMMKNTILCISILEQLRSIGFKLAIDDFGTGYSSLSYLRTLPVDLLKIDRSFVHLIPENVDNSMITNAIIKLANTLKKEVVAEGVENLSQLNFLKEKGCN